MNVEDQFQQYQASLTKRPLQYLLEEGHLGSVISDIDQRPVLKDYLEVFLRENDTPQQRELRRLAREKVLNTIQVDEAGRSNEIKMVIFDIDHTKGLLYPISSTTGEWALKRLAERHDLDINTIFEETRQVQPEFLCHSPHEFLNKLVEAPSLSNIKDALNPENPQNADIMRDWRDAVRVLNQQFFFKDIECAVPRIKNEGGLVYVATNGPPANVFHRLHLWFGDEGDKLFDGIAVRQSLPGMQDENRFASEREKAFVARLYADDKVIIVPEEHIKPNGMHIKYCVDHANDRLQAIGAPAITPSQIVLDGDSLGSDMLAARNYVKIAGQSVQSVYTAKGIVVAPWVLAAHENVGHKVDRLGPEVVLKKLEGDYARPNVALVEFDTFFEHYKIVPAVPRDKGPSSASAMIHQNSSRPTNERYTSAPVYIAASIV